MGLRASKVVLLDYLDQLPECYLLVSKEVLSVQEALLHSLEIWRNVATKNAYIQVGVDDWNELRSCKSGSNVKLASGTWKVTAELSGFFVLCCSKLVSTEYLLNHYQGQCHLCFVEAKRLRQK